MALQSQTTRRALQEAAAMRNRLQASLIYQIRRLQDIQPPQAMRQERDAELAALTIALEALRDRQQQASAEAQRRAEREVRLW